MNVTPAYNSVGTFFGYKPIYYVPKYQRGYAWDKLEIEDFHKDLEQCYQVRVGGHSQNHFFGGIVSVKHTVAGAVNQHKFELVDGQQRMATFVILVGAIIKIYRELHTEADAAGDNPNKSIIDNRVADLIKRFIEFEQEINRQPITQEVLTLSRADRQFFKDTVRDTNPNTDRDSHEKIKYAFDTTYNKVNQFTTSAALNDRLDNLEIVQNVVENDFTILHVETDSRTDAYRLFQVLNDRGKNLTEGDLLRAKTLEVLEGHDNEQDTIERLWDNILSDKPTHTGNFLRWIYASNIGNRAGKNTLFDDFLDHFYPAHSDPAPIVANAAVRIRDKTREVHDEIILCRKILDGEWPYNSLAPITSWDRHRIRLLVKELSHTLCVPLLIAACKLDHRQFSDLVQLIERFVFRYIMICNQHATPLVNIYHQECLEIRANPATYNVASLQGRLRTLQNNRADDTLFRANLDGLSYKLGGGNKALKYYLMTIEYYLQWYRNGATGAPQCINKAVVYDFTDTTIEHIYPRNAQGAVIDAKLEPIKNSLGNLTFLSPTENVTGANDDFTTKKPIYQASSVRMNREIDRNHAIWDAPAVNKRKDDLKNIACTVFTA